MNGKFGNNIWVSADQAEIAIEVVDDLGQSEIFIVQVQPRDRGPEPQVVECAVTPEALDGWAFTQLA